jgi:hypothetical protein
MVANFNAAPREQYGAKCTRTLATVWETCAKTVRAPCYLSLRIVSKQSVLCKNRAYYFTGVRRSVGSCKGGHEQGLIDVVRGFFQALFLRIAVH